MHIIFQKIFLSFFLCMSYLMKIFPHFVLNNSDMKNVKRCSPRIMLDLNASSIVIGLSLLFYLFLSRSSDSSRQHPTVIAYRIGLSRDASSLFKRSSSGQHSGLPRIYERKTARKDRRLYLSSVRASRAKCLGQRDLEYVDDARIEMVAFKSIEL